ncbi:tetratricopeptide repeat protein [Paraburkholderia sp. BL6669N2]|uniref:CHAT domain-containing tetratricopeptide repeat protein n=1 Tax=Paraburkholderia sp. BL6669N2 TaxID=1938807 RepID=UPI000E220576|nr:CHAT domain-containing protein [Paraburkholderia sp. BL6669N2]REG45544.1 tetratricopeptide repeat protein [Paraburkholderia sp. BL6669N2]
MGSYAKAEQLLERVIAIREKVLGPNNPGTARSLGNLAEVYRTAGEFAKAEPLDQRALAINEKVLGAEHPAVALSLDNLAELYREIGSYREAEPLYNRALTIREKTLGPVSPETAASLNNLALLYCDTGRYDDAAPLFKQALAINVKSLGPEHHITALTLNNIGMLYLTVGADKQAIEALQMARAIDEKALGLEHPNVARDLNNIALAYEGEGKYAQAESLYKRALAINENALGPANPNTSRSLNNLADLHWAQSNWSEAADNLRRGAQASELFSQSVLVLGGEPRKRAFMNMLDGETDGDVTFSLVSRGHVADAESFGMQVVLQRKGRVLDILADDFEAVRRSLAPGDRQLFEQWREITTQYASLLLRGPERMSPEQHRRLLDQVKAQATSFESGLSQRSIEFRQHVETVTLERVQQAIPEGAALIEWFRYHPFNPIAVGSEPKYGMPRYMAYVLKRQGAPAAVDLGDAKTIDTAISDLLAALRDPHSIVVKDIARDVEVRLMQPLVPYMGNVGRAYLAPDGQLNLVPFGALVDDKGNYLTQSFEFTYLTSGRDLLRSPSSIPSRHGPVIVADPNFDLLQSTVNESVGRPKGHSSEVHAGTLKFTPLPGTEAEAKAIREILHLPRERVLTGDTATASAVKQLSGPRILHLATHGFFLSDQAMNQRSEEAGFLAERNEQAPKGENPLLRSGLALAGANQLHAGGDDGILTALEVSGLDLAGTELVVLSACETGVGQVQNGEGVYGLRRAMVLAGVQTQVVSLWKVDDIATKDLMVAYYGRLSTGVGRSAALRAAQLDMLNDHKRAHPYYWASFVTIGAAGPLSP